jgi:Glycerol uptake facilitator and related permeases (Major Intrinsic Protein Family)
VTIGLWSVRQFPGRQVIPYVAAQRLGAVLASATLLWILGSEGGFGATTPAVATSKAFAVEAEGASTRRGAWGRRWSETSGRHIGCTGSRPPWE